MPAGDNSPFRRVTETPLECHGVYHAAEAVTDTVPGQIDIHVPLQRLAFEPVENIHRGLIESERHLERKVPIDLENGAHVRH